MIYKFHTNQSVITIMVQTDQVQLYENCFVAPRYKIWHTTLHSNKSDISNIPTFLQDNPAYTSLEKGEISIIWKSLAGFRLNPKDRQRLMIIIWYLLKNEMPYDCDCDLWYEGPILKSRHISKL